MNRYSPIVIIAALLLFLVAGCATVKRDAGFPAVRKAVEERTGYQVRWNTGGEEDRAIGEMVARTLARDLTVEEAVQLALLNNRRLQAVYEELGVAQAELVRAGLLKNPIFDGVVRFSSSASEVIELGLVDDFLQIFLIPLRKKVAAAQLEAAKFRVTSAVVDLASEVKMAFYQLQAAQQVLEMSKTMLLAAEASYEMAKRLRRAGNITELDLANEQALYEQTKLDVNGAELAVAERRERVTALMGLWGKDAGWSFVPKLAHIPEREVELDHLETRAVEKSLDLERMRWEFTAAAQRIGVVNVTSVIPEIEFGAHAERDPGEGWSLGPALSLPLPLFDQGQPARAEARAEMRKLWENYTSLAVEIRSVARTARNRTLMARQRAEYYRGTVIPLRVRITDQTQLFYNAMQVGVFALLEAKRMEIEAGRRYINELENYWIARTELEQLLSGRMAKGASFGVPTLSEASSLGPGYGGH